MDNPLSSANQTPLFKIIYKLYCSWYINCQTIPKKDRFTIGQKTENLLLEILTLIINAYHSKNQGLKIEYLTNANTDLECIKIIIRLAKDVKIINQGRYIEYEQQLQEAGKMLGGWISSLHKTNR